MIIRCAALGFLSGFVTQTVLPIARNIYKELCLYTSADEINVSLICFNHRASYVRKYMIL